MSASKAEILTGARFNDRNGERQERTEWHRISLSGN
jgi:hypothetical protein